MTIERARIRVTAQQWPKFYGGEYDAYRDSEAFAPSWWRTKNSDGFPLAFTPSEVRVLGRHSSGVDPQHPGELEPDAYDRMRYKYNEYGRHLLHTGSE